LFTASTPGSEPQRHFSDPPVAGHPHLAHQQDARAVDDDVHRGRTAPDATRVEPESAVSARSFIAEPEN